MCLSTLTKKSKSYLKAVRKSLLLVSPMRMLRFDNWPNPFPSPICRQITLEVGIKKKYMLSLSHKYKRLLFQIEKSKDAASVGFIFILGVSF